ncbi:MAG: hypothetical protein ACI93R_001207 [Flavobacteriales bacterium]|jgi:hypothetical protein
MSKHIVMLCGGKSQEPYLDEFKRRRWTVSVVDRDERAICRVRADTFYLCSTYSIEELKACLLELKGKVDLVFSNSSARAVAENIIKLNAWLGSTLPSPNEASLIFCYDKKRMRNALFNQSVNIPPILDYTDNHEGEITFPLILKPTKNSLGGCGVRIIYTLNDLKDVANLIEDGEHHIEPFIKGREYSVDGIVKNGSLTIVCITRKTSGIKRNDFIPDVFSTCSLDKKLEDVIFQQVTLSVKALHIDNCPISVDLKITPSNEVFIIECGIFWDSKIDRLLMFSGFNPYTYFIDSILLQTDPIIDLISNTAMEFIFVDSEQSFNKNTVKSRHPNDYIEYERETGDIVKPPSSVSDLVACRFYRIEQNLTRKEIQ